MVLQKSSSSMVFKVRRNPAELVPPAGPTPHELKLLSDIDDQKGLRHHLPLVQFFPYNPSMAGKDPAHVIKEALSKALVFYYPLAGRLREGPKGKLMVDCTGEGVLFIQAEADVTLDHFGVDPLPPFPCFHELLYDVPFSNDGIINSPLLLMQVTRLKCGGFIFAIRVNHTLCDGCGIGQLIKGIAEIAQGAAKPSIIPVWCRELLCARDPPRVTFIHHEYKQLPLHNKTVPTKPSQASFFFGPNEIDALRCLLPRHLAQSSTTFEVLTACIWRCHTAALQWQNPNQEVRLLCTVNARFEPCRFNPPLPEGYYGNAFVLPTAVSTVEMLCGKPLNYALELVKKAKKEASEEYVHSTADLMATNGRPAFSMTGSFIVSDITKCGFRDVDYGWGKPLYSGLVRAGIDDISGVSYYVPYTNSKAEHGRVVLICLPSEKAIKRFGEELNGILQIKDEEKPI
ncbi:13-hydroxylupanine O-tigloyltransferase-like [Arachis stenosperma]|uniref:13-hydroxylupanine O-tigloyltransferase-like n=1 Tax=Arachis stenosperma TaxID=217475 RepID=UPI0025AC73FF|nr:13-hydroxylupanine O-tigloyltransferase-like [Arachis stenosperma]